MEREGEIEVGREGVERGEGGTEGERGTEEQRETDCSLIKNVK